jgi:exopolysaccharide production protein ExoQ
MPPLRPLTAPARAVSVATIFRETEARRRLAQKTPELPAPVAVAYVAVSVVIMAFSGLFTVLPILAFLLMWLTIPLYKGRATLMPALDMGWLLALPLLGVFSTLWSDYPATTLYQSSAFSAMMLCVLLMNRVVGFTPLAKGIALGVSAVLLITVASAIHTRDFMSGSTALIGYFGSKNMVGLFAQIAVITGGITYVHYPSLLPRLLYSAAPAALGAYCLIASRSASSIVSCAVALGLTGSVVVLSRLPVKLRRVAIVALVLLGTAGAGAGMALGLDSIVLQAIGKDSTLTGRTYLWQEGQKIGWQKPIAGHGYAAFWVHGQPDAERYWREFLIDARTGFHFHNAHIQTLVDMGILGVLLTSALYLTTLAGSITALLRAPATAEHAWLLCLALMFAVRSLVEVDILGPFGIGVFLFYSIVARLKLPSAATRLSTANERSAA